MVYVSHNRTAKARSPPAKKRQRIKTPAPGAATQVALDRLALTETKERVSHNPFPAVSICIGWVVGSHAFPRDGADQISVLLDKINLRPFGRNASPTFGWCISRWWSICSVPASFAQHPPGARAERAGPRPRGRGLRAAAQKVKCTLFGRPAASGRVAF